MIRNCGPVGYPGGAEVVNMQPPAALLKPGINALPTMGDGRQSGTSGSPSILNVSPEAAVGGGLALLQTGDRIRIDLNTRKVDVLIPEAELARAAPGMDGPGAENKTPWEEIYRCMVGQHDTGACLEPATLYLDIVEDARREPGQPLRHGKEQSPGRARPPSSRRPRRASAAPPRWPIAAEGAQVIATDLNEAKLAEIGHGIAHRRAGRARTRARSTPRRGGRRRSTSCSTAPASCTRAPSWTRRTRTGTSPSR